MHPMIYIPILPNLQIHRSPSDFSLPSRDPNLLGAFHGWNYLLWHPDAFGPLSFVGLLVGLDCYHLSVLFLLDQIWCSSLFVHLFDVGVGDFAWWLLLELLLDGFCLSFCLCLSPVIALHWKDLWPSMWHSLQITVSPSTDLFTLAVVLSCGGRICYDTQVLAGQGLFLIGETELLDLQ